jgi:BirA family biotin operon repressor/biotin-[acetyl-CoA-carboxylase] ligase
MDAVIHLQETDSTNDVMHRLLSGADASQVQEGTLVYADFQTKGRGQGSHTWESEDGANLLFTMVLFPDFVPADQQFLLSQVAALGVADYLTRCCGLSEVSVKWPNDVYYKDRKICGMLLEAQLMNREMEYVLLGVGINLNQLLFISDAPNPVSVRQITGCTVVVAHAAEQVRECIMARYMTLAGGDKQKIRNDYAEKLYRRSGFFRYMDAKGPFEAEIVAVRDAGDLVLRRRDGEENSYLFGEVKFVL